MIGGLFVDRERELPELRSGLEDALNGRGGLFLIGGESGIGKTRLADELAAEAAQRGAKVVWGSAWEAGGAPAYWPWVQVLRELVRGLAGADRARLRETLAAGASYVAQLVPDVREALPDLPPAPALESEQARFGLFDAIATFLRDRAAEQPLVLVLDDLHWADGPSLLLLEFLARTLNTVPLMAVATCRDIEQVAEPALVELLGRLGRVGRRIHLGGLPQDPVAQLVAAHTGGEARPALVRRVAELTEGNPLFVDEVMLMLVAEGRLADAEGAGALPLPVGVRETIQRRLEPLPEATRELLALASAIGVEFSLDTLAAVAHLNRDEVLALLETATEARILDDRPGEPGRWQFTHALVRETLYESLGKTNRARLHKEIGEALEQRYITATSRDLSALAHHFFEAATVGDAVKALDYAADAGDRAMRVLAYEHAETMYRRALQALELLGADEERRCRLLISLGEAQTRAGDHAAGRETLRRAVELARGLGDPRLLASAALRFTPWGLSTAVIDEELVAVLQEALDRLPAEARPQHARLVAQLAAALYWSAPAERRLALAQEAITDARELGDTETLALVLVQSHIATWDPDSIERSVPWAEEILALSERSGNLESALHAHTWRVSLMLERGDLAAVDRSIAAIAQLAGKLNQPRARAYVPVVRALRALLDGRVQEAQQLNQQAAELAGEVTQDTIGPMLVASQLFWIRWAQGRLADLEPAVRHLAETYPMIPSWRCALVACLRAAGREHELRAELNRLGARGFADLPRDNVWLVGLGLLCEACAELGESAHAAALDELLAPYDGRHAVSPIAAYAGPVSRYRGLLAAARGRHDEALVLLARARAEAAMLGARPLLAMIALDEANVHAARGDARSGARLAGEAAALAGELGLDGVCARAHELATRLADGAGSASHEQTVPPAAEHGALRCEGEMWTIEWGACSLHQRDSKGLRYLARLLAAPGVEIHALELIGAQSPTRAGARTIDDLPIRGPGDDAVPGLDEQAKAQYRARLTELREELEQAEEWGDPERAAAAREELEFIARELSAAVGLGGRDRPTGSSEERARVNATRAIRTAISRLAAADARLGHHLASTVKTGTFCRYEPGPGAAAWEIT
jgi:hypothetical protein